MKTVVVDSSVALKWFVPELHSDRAASLLETSIQLAAPDLLVDLEGELRTTDASTGLAQACTPGPHESTMALTLHAPGLDVSMPVDLDRASATEAPYASYRLTICSDGVPPTTLVALRLVLDALFRPPSTPGRHVWRGRSRGWRTCRPRSPGTARCRTADVRR